MKAVVPSQVELRIPRSCEFVRVARKTAAALAHQLDFTIHDVADIELAVSEACTNAVEHVASEECREILVRFSVNPGQLVMEVVDQGPGFDPAQPAAPEEDEEGFGGLGLLVIRALMDELDVTCDAETGTCVRMVKYRADADGARGD
jgi:anti-sigma regulatory factor (Ser/Thr protein kinase)